VVFNMPRLSEIAIQQNCMKIDVETAADKNMLEERTCI